jgi:hypothetical protein
VGKGLGGPRLGWGLGQGVMDSHVFNLRDNGGHNDLTTAKVTLGLR